MPYKVNTASCGNVFTPNSYHVQYRPTTPSLVKRFHLCTIEIYPPLWQFFLEMYFLKKFNKMGVSSHAENLLVISLLY